MANTRSAARYIPVTNPNEKVTHVKIYAGYSKGGTSMFSGAHEERGVYIYIRPVVRTGIFEKYGLFAGGKLMVASMGRFSEKKLDEIAMRMFREIDSCGERPEFGGKLWALVNNEARDLGTELAPRAEWDGKVAQEEAAA